MNYYGLFMEQKKSGFFNLSKEEQDLIKNKNPSWESEYEILLYRSICKMEGSLQELETRELDILVELEFNKHKLKYHGVGKDNIQIIGHFQKNKSTIDYDNMLDYDKDLYDLRVEVTQEALGRDSKPLRKYRLELPDIYGRGELTNEKGEKEFAYLFFSPITSVFEETIETEALNTIHDLVPHDFISIEEGQEISETDEEDDYNILSYEIEANGKESLVIGLRDFAMEEIENMSAEIAEEFNTKNIDKIIMKRIEVEDGVEVYYYFTSDRSAELAKIKDWENSIKDLIVEDAKDFTPLLTRKVEKIKKLIELKYEELLLTFKPEENAFTKKAVVQVAVSNAEIYAIEDAEDMLDYIDENMKDIEEVEKEEELAKKKSIFKIIKDKD